MNEVFLVYESSNRQLYYVCSSLRAAELACQQVCSVLNRSIDDLVIESETVKSSKYFKL